MRPPRYRITADERIVPAYDGVNTNDSPTMVAQTQAPVVDNFVVGRKGKLLMRGPINQSVQVRDVADTKRVTAVWTYDDKLLISTGTGGNNSRYPSGGATANGNRYHADLSTLTDTLIGAGALTNPHTRLGSFVYGRGGAVGVGVQQVGDANGPFLPDYGLVKWDGTNVAGGITGVGTAPHGFLDVKAHLNRLFVLGGKAADGSSTFIEPQTLYWSDVNGPLTGGVADWQDDVSGLTNRIVIETDDRNDTCMALARLGRSLAILKRKSISLLTGTAPSNFAIRRVISGVGCICQESVLELNDSFIFASDAGLMLYDGAQLTNLTMSVQAEFLSASLAAGATVRCGRLPSDNILVTVLDSTGRTTTFARVLHLPSRAWWTLSSNSLATPLPLLGEQAATIAWCWDDQGVFLLDKAITPELAPAAERGFDQVGVTKKRIPARWWSRLAQFALPANAAALDRLLMDYAFYISGGTDNDNGWFVSLVTGSGKTLLAPTQVLAQADSGSSYAYRRQAQIDVFAETPHDAQIRVEWKDDGSNTYPAVTRAEIHDAFLIFQFAGERQST